MPDPIATQLFETVLYASDLAAAARFYREVLGLRLLRQNSLMLVFATESGYLLIFDPEQSAQPGRQVPSHGAIGPGHIAFSAPASTLPGWREKLRKLDVPIETEVVWDGDRGRSIYMRDPAGNSVELAPPGLWSLLEEA